MQSSFDRALTAVLKHEGGWADHPKDPGGATNRGITLATFRRFVKPGGTKADLKAMTVEQAAVVYRKQYWAIVMGDQLPAGVDYAVFDYAVNSGPSRAVKALQKIVGATADGVIGPKTLAAVNATVIGPGTHKQLINALCDQRQAFVERLDTFSTFGKGWTSRIKSVRKLALEMAAEGFEPVPAPTTPPTPETPATDHASGQNRAWEIDWKRVGIAAALVGLVAYALIKTIV